MAQVPSNDVTALRRRAEATLSRIVTQSAPSLAPENVDALVHELRVHQIELEMQNHELRQAQEDLSESRNSYRELYESIPIGYVTIDPSSLILNINPAGITLLGGERALKQAKHFNAFFSDREVDPFILFCRGIVSAQTADTAEFAMKRQDGSEFFAALQAVSVHTREGTRLRITFKNITRRKEAEDTLRRQQIELGANRVALQDLTAKLFTAQEEECKRIARELHDDHCQRVTALILEGKMVAKLCEHQAPDLAPRMISISARLTELLRDLRELSHKLLPRNLGDISLVGPLRELIEGFNGKAGFQISLSERDVPEKLTPVIMTTLFRLLQESLSNVVKHAQAKQVSVVLAGMEQRIELTVADDGIGFDPGRMSDERKAVGIVGMKERVRPLGGTVTIDSGPDHGTTIIFSIPL